MNSGERRDDGPDLEAVLASIRRVIEIHQFLPIDASSAANPTRSYAADPDPDHFELPSLFRAAAREDEARRSIGMDRLAIAHAETRAPSTEDGTTRSPAPAATTPATRATPAADHPRIMPPVKDTLISRMGESALNARRAMEHHPTEEPAEEDGFCLRTVHSNPSQAPDLSHAIAAVQRMQIPTARLGPRNFLLGGDAAEAPGEYDDQPASAEVHRVSAEEHRLPGALSAGDNATSDSAASVLDAQTASLLRPLLRQWLDENMTQLLTKALHIEMNESQNDRKK